MTRFATMAALKKEGAMGGSFIPAGGISPAASARAVQRIRDGKG
jgi:hypothetical protein